MTVQSKPCRLALLAEAERRYDGPFPDEAALDEDERRARRLSDALATRRFFATRVRRAIHFARLHRSQARPDLCALMLADTRDYREGFRLWHRRVAALRRLDPDF